MAKKFVTKGRTLLVILSGESVAYKLSSVFSAKAKSWQL